jgi:hypothetical protein
MRLDDNIAHVLAANFIGETVRSAPARSNFSLLEEMLTRAIMNRSGFKVRADKTSKSHSPY